MSITTDKEALVKHLRTWLETKHRLLAALRDGRLTAAVMLNSLMQDLEPYLRLFLSVNGCAVLENAVFKLRRGGILLACPQCASLEMTASCRMEPVKLAFESALTGRVETMYLLVGHCERCGNLVLAANQETVRQIFSGFRIESVWGDASGAIGGESNGKAVGLN